MPERPRDEEILNEIDFDTYIAASMEARLRNGLSCKLIILSHSV
jgi:hypothetical protein